MQFTIRVFNFTFYGQIAVFQQESHFITANDLVLLPLLQYTDIENTGMGCTPTEFVVVDNTGQRIQKVDI